MNNTLAHNQLALFIDFENVAIWAEENFFDLDLDRLMSYLQSRGPVVVKRVYGDWSRFRKYRDALANNSMDLIQMYSVRSGKNRADIRLTLDAAETANLRPLVSTIVIVSGDSDFGELASRLREYGKYVIGIGPKAITHDLLVNSCDEFLYLDTLLSNDITPVSAMDPDRDKASDLLMKALEAHGQRGELPVLATKLKQTMVFMDPTFNEANLGYRQFRDWLEDNNKQVKLDFEGLNMYVAPLNFRIPNKFAASEASRGTAPQAAPAAKNAANARPVVKEPSPAPASQETLNDKYKKTFTKVMGVDQDTRRDILRDIYREFSEHPALWTYGKLLDELQKRYETKGLVRSKTTLRKVMQLGYHMQAYRYLGEKSVDTPIELDEHIDSQPAFIRAAESRFPYACLQAGYEVDLAEMAAVLLGDRMQGSYIQELLDDLVKRSFIIKVNGGYQLTDYTRNPLINDAQLKPVIQDILDFKLTGEVEKPIQVADEFHQTALSKRLYDFSGAAQDSLYACRLLWDAYENEDPEASLDTLRWYIASYTSAKAGELVQVLHDYARARGYYLAFFHLVQEDTPLWSQMRGLINPMLSYYWRSIAYELEAELETTNAPSKMAIQMSNHPSQELRQNWVRATEILASINPEVLQRVSDSIRALPDVSEEGRRVADQLDQMLGNNLNNN